MKETHLTTRHVLDDVCLFALVVFLYMGPFPAVLIFFVFFTCRLLMMMHNDVIGEEPEFTLIIRVFFVCSHYASHVSFSHNAFRSRVNVAREQFPMIEREKSTYPEHGG